MSACKGAKAATIRRNLTTPTHPTIHVKKTDNICDVYTLKRNLTELFICPVLTAFKKHLLKTNINYYYY